MLLKGSLKMACAHESLNIIIEITRSKYRVYFAVQGIKVSENLVDKRDSSINWILHCFLNACSNVCTNYTV